MRWALTLLIFTTCFGQDSLQRAVQQGRDLNANQAEALEQQLASNPSTVEARARLIGYYFGQVSKLKQDTPDEIRAQRGRHVRWFIENDPGSPVLSTGEAFAMSGWLNDPQNYGTIRDLWLAEVERSPDNLAVLRNATFLLQQHDRPAALKLIRHAYEITAGQDLKVADYYGVQLGLLWLGQGNDGSASSKTVAAEIDSSKDARVIGSAGRTLVQYANPGGEPADYAGRLLTKAIALAPNDRIVLTWERDVQRLQSGNASSSLWVSGRTQLLKRTNPADPEASAPNSSGDSVLVNAEIWYDGTVKHTIALSGPKELQSSAAATVKQWRFEPTLINGKPMVVYSTFEVRSGAPKLPQR